MWNTGSFRVHEWGFSPVQSEHINQDSASLSGQCKQRAEPPVAPQMLLMEESRLQNSCSDLRALFSLQRCLSFTVQRVGKLHYQLRLGGINQGHGPWSKIVPLSLFRYKTPSKAWWFCHYMAYRKGVLENCCIHGEKPRKIRQVCTLSCGHRWKSHFFLTKYRLLMDTKVLSIALDSSICWAFPECSLI